MDSEMELFMYEQQQAREEYIRKVYEEQHWHELLQRENYLTELVYCIEECLVWLHEEKFNK